ncbi:MAG: hypothetical protein WBC92_14545 [Terracidiphilus sp.]
MRRACLALAALLLVSQSVQMPAEDRASVLLIGTYLGNELRPDNANPYSSPLYRTYYVRTEEGTWSLVSSSDVAELLVHTVAVASGHNRSDRANLLDSLKRWEKFSFRVEADRRPGAGRNAFLVYIPRTDNPRKEDRFEADFTPSVNPVLPPTGN